MARETTVSGVKQISLSSVLGVRISPAICRFRPTELTTVGGTVPRLGDNKGLVLADILDNSISAEASEIKVNFHWNAKNSFITIAENGRGMDADELLEAMRLGSRDPRDKRNKSDLGRFGLGLKTASFSQCLKLTVTRH